MKSRNVIHLLSRRESTLSSNFLAIFEENDGKGHHGHSEKREQAGSPLVTEFVVHLNPKEWEGSLVAVSLSHKSMW